MTTVLEKGCKTDVGLPKLPRLIFLDTNIVQNLWSFGEFIFDNSLEVEMEPKLSAKGKRFAEDICALAEFMALGRRAGWPIAVSPGTLGELEATPQLARRIGLTTWGKELAYYFASNMYESQDANEESGHFEFGHYTVNPRQEFSDLLKFLPHENDRQLIIDALESDSEIFLTMDYRSVSQHRDKLKRTGLLVMTPAELLNHIGPWIGLQR